MPARPPASTEEFRDIIREALHSTDSAVRADYVKHFSQEIEVFASSMAAAMVAWDPLDNVAGDRERAFVAALTHAAVTLHIESMKLFISGHIIAAGNLFRQVVETIALSLLCCVREFPYLKHFMDNRYSTSKAVDDLLKPKNARRLRHADREALKALRDAREFYHLYSHPTMLTLAVQMSFAGEGNYVGACFDPGKVDQYRREIAGGVGLARVFPGIMEVIKANMAEWQTAAIPAPVQPV
jgi:hypothetical protein